MNSKVLLIYTGGTIGMITDPENGALKPFDFSQITTEVPELKKLDCEIETLSFLKPIDSSNMHPDIWVELVEIIDNNYLLFDGFVILHGSDTMAYSASALSFMLQNLNKPVIFTGSQLPIGVVRTDGKENLITAIEIAASKKEGKPTVPEVCIYFEYQLYRGNRTTKINADHFEAFESFNYPKLAEAGIDIDYNHNYIQAYTNGAFNVIKNYDNNIAVLKIFPGITESFITHFFNAHNLKAVVMETFGAGNAITEKWFLEIIGTACQKGIIIVNVTQCKAGSVNQGKYETGRGLTACGVIGGRDITFEAAITKLMIIMGSEKNSEEVKRQFIIPMAGEISN